MISINDLNTCIAPIFWGRTVVSEIFELKFLGVDLLLFVFLLLLFVFFIGLRLGTRILLDALEWVVVGLDAVHVADLDLRSLTPCSDSEVRLNLGGAPVHVCDQS